MRKQANFQSQKFLRDILLLASVGFVLLLAPPAAPQTGAKLPGELWVSGRVEVNGEGATTGQTVFTGYKIKTKADSAAMINLGKQVGRIKFLPETEMTVSFTSATIGGDLRKGVVIVTVPLGVQIYVTTAAGVVVSHDRSPSTLALEAKPDETSVAAARGEADLKTGRRKERVSTGEEVTMTISAGTRRRRDGALLLAAAPALAAPIILGTTPGVDNPPPVTPTGVTSTSNLQLLLQC